MTTEMGGVGAYPSRDLRELPGFWEQRWCVTWYRRKIFIRRKVSSSSSLIQPTVPPPVITPSHHHHLPTPPPYPPPKLKRLDKIQKQENIPYEIRKTINISAMGNMFTDTPPLLPESWLYLYSLTMTLFICNLLMLYTIHKHLNNMRHSVR